MTNDRRRAREEWRPVRSLLFAPANRPDLLKKFVRYDCDAYAIDLEDATPAAAKESARSAMPDVVAELRKQTLSGLLLVRTNETTSSYFAEDLAAALAAGVDGIIVPKLSSVDELRRLDATLAAATTDHARSLAVIGLIETALGVTNVESLAACNGRHLAALAFGAEDFITDMRGERTSSGMEVLYARSRVVLAARAAGLGALDQVFVDIKDDDGFRRDAAMGRQLGYDGKMCVVPHQAEMANELFTPSTDEVARSLRLIEAYRRARAEGRGSIEFEGRMIDEPLLKRAEAIVRLGRARHT